MSAEPRLGLRTCTFGNLGAGVWGVVAADAPGGAPTSTRAQLGNVPDGGTWELGGARLHGSSPEEQWGLQADDVDLTLSAQGEAADLAPTGYGVAGFAQLCRVTGSFLAGGVVQELDCFGQRGTRAASPDPGRVDSLRDITTWFGADDGLALLAVRPRRAAGHDRDAVSCVLFGAGAPVVVAEPRLSSTYTVAGAPARASLELWLEERGDEDEDEDEDGEIAARHFPRRAAGEALGAAARVSIAGLDLRAHLFRWHMSGRDGAGVYLIARPV